MIKAIFLIAKRADLTVRQFRDYYEDHHVGLALGYIRPFIKGYRRNYPGGSHSYFDTVESNAGTAAPGFAYDCLTEMWFESEAELQAMFDRLSEPDVRAVIAADEDRFLDPQSVMFLKCEECITAL